MRSLFAILIVLLLAVEPLFASDASYRLAGVVSRTNGDFMALIETPDGQQFLAMTGDSIEGVEVLEISDQSILLGFHNRKERLLLEGAEHEDLSGSGVLANAYRERIEDATDNVADLLPGLVDMDYLPADARVLAVNGLVVDNSDAAMEALHAALAEGRQIRLTLSENALVPVIYLAPADSFDELSTD